MMEGILSGGFFPGGFCPGSDVRGIMSRAILPVSERHRPPIGRMRVSRFTRGALCSQRWQTFLLLLATTTDASWSRRTGGRMSTSADPSKSVTARGGSRAVAPSRRRAGDTSSLAAASSTARYDYRLHLIVTASVGGCLLVFNVTLFFCLYCHRRVRRHCRLH